MRCNICKRFGSRRANVPESLKQIESSSEATISDVVDVRQRATKILVFSMYRLDVAKCIYSLNKLIL